MALLLNKYIFKPFKQNQKCGSLLLDLFTCVDSLATIRRRNHNALRFETTKFPYPVNGNRHQLVKPRPPPSPPSQVKCEYKQEVTPPVRKNERTEGARPSQRLIFDDHFCNDDVDNDTKNKVSKFDKSLEANVSGSGQSGLGQKFRGFFNSLKSPGNEDFDPMPKKVAMMQDRFLEHRKSETSGLIVAPTLMEQHEQKQKKQDKEQSKKLQILYKGYALRMAIRKDREKELTTSLEKIKIAKRMEYLMKLQHVMETKEPITDSSLVQRHVPLYAELRSTIPDKKHLPQFAFAPYTPASPRSDNADFPHTFNRDTNAKSKNYKSNPGMGDSLINRVCKGLSLDVAKKNSY